MSLAPQLAAVERHMEGAVAQMRTFKEQMSEVVGVTAQLNEFNGNLRNLLQSMDLVASCMSFPDVELLAREERARQQDLATRLEEQTRAEASAREKEAAALAAPKKRSSKSSRPKLDGSERIGLAGFNVPPRFRSGGALEKLESVLEQVRVAGDKGVDVVSVVRDCKMTSILANECLGCLQSLGFVVRTQAGPAAGASKRGARPRGFVYQFVKMNNPR